MKFESLDTDTSSDLLRHYNALSARHIKVDRDDHRFAAHLDGHVRCHCVMLREEPKDATQQACTRLSNDLETHGTQ